MWYIYTYTHKNLSHKRVVHFIPQFVLLALLRQVFCFKHYFLLHLWYYPVMYWLTYVPLFDGNHYHFKTYRPNRTYCNFICSPLFPSPFFFFGHHYLSQNVGCILLPGMSLTTCFFTSHGEGRKISMSEIDKIFTGQ